MLFNIDISNLEENFTTKFYVELRFYIQNIGKSLLIALVEQSKLTIRACSIHLKPTQELFGKTSIK